MQVGVANKRVEVVIGGDGHGVGCEPFLDGRTKLYEPQDLARSVVGSQVEVPGPLRERWHLGKRRGPAV